MDRISGLMSWAGTISVLLLMGKACEPLLHLQGGFLRPHLLPLF
jgi:hypothetical protein